MKQVRDEQNNACLLLKEQASYSKARKAFLISLYYPKADKTGEKSNEAFVTVQASHEANTYKFKDLASAFAHLETLVSESLAKEVPTVKP